MRNGRTPTLQKWFLGRDGTVTHLQHFFPIFVTISRHRALDPQAA
jgi:hypothetical protein